MLTKNIVVTNKAGLHAKPASLFVQTANEFSSEIYISKGSTRVNAKSIMGVMILAVSKGDEILLEVNGDDEKAAMDRLTSLIENKFGMPDE
ncbi:HPr family phosphocarrier protein [uncultured Pseudoramibacter sp.]|jgi:phosphotransferase system HPr (HPr) family protein|uniref:HPr family phosphocarrier protein n=1 Tax=Candidatus Pseudoramibacter fermentans TaxID=2594427 RepID=A0A6L5GS36_9FIRM|nr:HPr family phosphocarrier protein [uncultured Pseudoramibacter sp.]MQM73044.1 HPr family phosphocarrier protein [Candidatus Pseudoramibacter fermentans]RRF93617.1 MAG: HPr family phosphocarrier protein [Eubacteriaceae bacterium]